MLRLLCVLSCLAALQAAYLQKTEPATIYVPLEDIFENVSKQIYPYLTKSVASVKSTASDNL